MKSGKYNSIALEKVIDEVPYDYLEIFLRYLYEKYDTI
jgi:hypothetical protein